MSQCYSWWHQISANSFQEKVTHEYFCHILFDWLLDVGYVIHLLLEYGDMGNSYILYWSPSMALGSSSVRCLIDYKTLCKGTVSSLSPNPSYYPASDRNITLSPPTPSRNHHNFIFFALFFSSSRTYPTCTNYSSLWAHSHLSSACSAFYTEKKHCKNDNLLIIAAHIPATRTGKSGRALRAKPNSPPSRVTKWGRMYIEMFTTCRRRRHRHLSWVSSPHLLLLHTYYRRRTIRWCIAQHTLLRVPM